MTAMQRSKPFAPRRVTCLACKGLARYASDNPYRPFCGERCRNLDLGDWASDSFRVPATPQQDDGEPADPRLEPH